MHSKVTDHLARAGAVSSTKLLYTHLCQDVDEDVNPLKGSGNLFAGDNVLTPKGYRVRYCHIIDKNTDCPTLNKEYII